MAALPHPLHVQPALQDPAPRQPWVATILRTVDQQLSPKEVHPKHSPMVGMLDERFLQATELLADVGPDTLAFTAFFVAHWRQGWSNNPKERLNKET